MDCCGGCGSKWSCPYWGTAKHNHMHICAMLQLHQHTTFNTLHVASHPFTIEILVHDCHNAMHCNVCRCRSPSGLNGLMLYLWETLLALLFVQVVYASIVFFRPNTNQPGHGSVSIIHAACICPATNFSKLSCCVWSAT